MDIFFVNKIPFLIALSHNIDFTATINFPTHKYRDLFKVFWIIYVLNLKHGFKIMIVNAAREFYPVQEIIV